MTGQQKGIPVLLIQHSYLELLQFGKKLFASTANAFKNCGIQNSNISPLGEKCFLELLKLCHNIHALSNIFNMKYEILKS